MRNPIDVLNTLSKEAIKPNYQFKRLYRNLYNPEFYYIAYEKLSKNNGALTKGTDSRTINNMSLERIDKLIETIRNHTYTPVPVKRVLIPKKNGKLRPLGIPSFEDKMVQEVIRMIIEAIYEPNFKDCSHGFRPMRNCHTALNEIVMWNGTKWFVEGDIKGCFDNIDHHILINALRERIKDEYFIALIWKFLRAGYMQDWTYHKTYSGTPQGGIISPLLANVYLNKFDEYMLKYIEEFNQGKTRKRNKEYKKIEFQIKKIKGFINTGYGKLENKLGKNHELNDDEIKMLQGQLKELYKKQKTIPSLDDFDPNYRRMTYVRYADDFLIGVAGSKNDCKKIKEDITIFMANELKLELSAEKTLITNSSDMVRFLGYDITVNRTQIAKKNSKGIVTRTLNGKPSLYVPTEVWQRKLQEYKAIKIEYQNGKEVWKPYPRTGLMNYDEVEIINRYNAEIRGLYNYYRLALNSTVLQKFHNIMKFSFIKTLAQKNRTTSSKTVKSHKFNKDLVVKYSKKGKPAYIYFYNEGFRRQPKVDKKYLVSDELPNVMKYTPLQGRTSLVSRLKAKVCEYCGAENVKLQMHHIKAVKDLKGKTDFERNMIARRRKQIALCTDCHLKQRLGKL